MNATLRRVFLLAFFACLVFSVAGTVYKKLEEPKKIVIKVPKTPLDLLQDWGSFKILKVGVMGSKVDLIENLKMVTEKNAEKIKFNHWFVILKVKTKIGDEEQEQDITIEKVPQIQIMSLEKKKKEKKEFHEILGMTDLDKSITIKEMFCNLYEKFPSEILLSYEFVTNNCQDFSLSILQSINLKDEKIDEILKTIAREDVCILVKEKPIRNNILLTGGEKIGKFFKIYFSTQKKLFTKLEECNIDKEGKKNHKPKYKNLKVGLGELDHEPLIKKN